MNIIRYYHQNRKMIWLVIIAIIILIIAIQALNNIVKNQNKNKPNNLISEKEYENNLNINVLISEESVKEDEELIIDQFLRYCNAKKIEEAYALLSESCKKELFPAIEYFKQNYYNLKFSTTKLYSKEHFTGNTYKIKLYDDILITGSVNSNSTEDYFTIKKENNSIKLNISNYIDSKTINKSSTNDNLQVKVINKQTYKEYEKYEMQITNLTYDTILLDSKESTKSMYLIGDNNVRYYSLSHEVLKENLILKPKATITIEIKYNKEYNSNKIVNQLVFSDVILDYDLYKENRNDYADRKIIKVTI